MVPAAHCTGNAGSAPLHFDGRSLALSRSRLESMLTHAWMRRGMLAWLLLPVSLVFYALAVIRRQLYARGWLASERMPVPVIVVGNIFVGGTGKTPLTIWLVQALQQAGYTPGVISRGYGASADTPRLVQAGAAPQEVGDEPLLIAERTRCSVMVGRRRTQAARALLASFPAVDVIVSDDGLQHYALRRDIEIVLFDERGTGNGWLLPAGPLREPPTRRRDFTVINTPHALPAMPDQDLSRMRLASEAAERLADRSERMPLSALAETSERRIVAAAGIGNPARFFTMLRDKGIDCREMPLPDHYDFAVNPFADVVADIILITEKDAVKCARIDALKHDRRIWVVPVVARLDGALLEQLLEKLRGQSIA
jgi:tetraacyldisaccharide 4'-kinase